MGEGGDRNSQVLSFSKIVRSLSFAHFTREALEMGKLRRYVTSNNRRVHAWMTL